jgi:5-methyltetrahydrofolate--homocysteine methyltransferase
LSIAEQLKSEPPKRILIKDGAYGTQVQARKLTEADYRGAYDLGRDQKGNNDLLNLTRPDIVGSIATAFADAGAEILATNSFNANRISMADYAAEHLVRDINVAAARIIAQAAPRRRGSRRSQALRRRRARADQQDAVAVSRRERSGLSRDRLRFSVRRLCRAD